MSWDEESEYRFRKLSIQVNVDLLNRNIVEHFCGGMGYFSEPASDLGVRGTPFVRRNAS